MNNVHIRTARPNDLPRIRQIIRQAKTLLKVRQVNQWQDGYPNQEILHDDIARGKGYVLETQGEVNGYFALSFEDETPYRRIEQGAWLSDGAYCVLHRFALTEKLRGTGAALKVLEFWEQATLAQNIFSLRADTHPENYPMQHLLARCGFTNCGIIFVREHQARHAFEKVLCR